jgi:hypothetical protein
MKKTKHSGYLGIAAAAAGVVVVVAAVASFGSWNLALAGNGGDPGLNDTYTLNFMMSDAPASPEPKPSATGSVASARAGEDAPVVPQMWVFTREPPTRGN